MAERVYMNDTATIEATLYDETGTAPLGATSVSWQVKKPDGSVVTGGPQPLTEASVDIGFTNTDLDGPYASQVTFTLLDGSLRSTVLGFSVYDPLATSDETGDSPEDVTVDMTWLLIEDIFDSELGGPRLSDITKNSFDRHKLSRFLPRAYYNIGNTFQPAVAYDASNFPFTTDTPLLSQALLVESIKHLMRSYVEQYRPVGGGNITYFDRRDYLQRWQSMLTIEQAQLMTWLDLFKKDQMAFGQTSTLVGGYATWYGRYPRYMRGRYPYIYRF